MVVIWHNYSDELKNISELSGNIRNCDFLGSVGLELITVTLASFIIPPTSKC